MRFITTAEISLNQLHYKAEKSSTCRYRFTEFHDVIKTSSLKSSRVNSGICFRPAGFIEKARNEKHFHFLLPSQLAIKTTAASIEPTNQPPTDFISSLFSRVLSFHFHFHSYFFNYRDFIIIIIFISVGR